MLDVEAVKERKRCAWLGAAARADSTEDVTADLERLGLTVQQWYGVRVFTDPAAVDEPPPADDTELAALLDVEDRAGRCDPYRHLASQVHLIARKGG